MSHEVIYDENGEPSRVIIDDGYMQTARPYDREKDVWMLDQLDPRDFPAIDMGRQTAALVKEVNLLRRQLFSAEAELRMWRKSGPFGSAHD